MSKKIVKIEIVKPGSNPDVDSDFNTEYREKALEHVTELYGKRNVANIVTFNTLAAKAAFKSMCTIYQVPFAQANKIASLVPPPIEGVDCTINDIFDPSSPRYAEGADFRTATAEEYWRPIIEGARAIEGRNKSSGVHPCGIIMSSKPLDEYIPLHVRERDGRVITQWTYQECESIGLIKMDFLGLDTVDLIQHSVEYIQKSGKKAPNMLEIINGPMNDKKTFDMISRGDTIGVFQLASPGVQDLLKRMKPTELADITATTALYRPGPMGMNSHIKYADRKNGREETDYIHPEFKGSPLEKILKETYGLCVPADTKILNAETGEYVEIKDAHVGMKTSSYNEKTQSFEIDTVDEVLHTGMKDILKITLDGDRVLRVSSEHPVLTRRGYVRAEEITSDDEVAVVNQELPLGSDVNSELSSNSAYLLGLLQGGKETSYKKFIKPLLSDFGYEPSVKPWKKRFFNPILQQNNETLLQVLSGLFDSNDEIDIEDPHFTTQSESIFESIQLFLIRLGIDFGVSKVSETSRKGTFFTYRVHLTKEDYEAKLLPNSRVLKERKGSFGAVSLDKERFRKVVSVESDGTEDCYDLEVRNNHNFIVSGVIVHNCIYQEQVMQIANQIAGFTLQEADKLRKAMGKKKIDVLMHMKPKFFEGAKNNGYSEDAIQTLWNTLEPFAKYGFNKSHSVAYSINAYQAAFLKANYPVEFMAALISQNVGNKEKILAFLQEARKMGLKVGSVDINISDIKVAPDFSHKSQFDIVYGLSGINAVSVDVAEIIKKERETNGDFSSVQDVINRCMPLGVSNKKIYENLALAGAFDSFGVTRRGVVEQLPSLLNESKTKSSMGQSLFDVFGMTETYEGGVDLSKIQEFPFVEKLKREADVIGLYLTDHPLSKVGPGISSMRTSTVKDVLKSTDKSVVTLAGSITEITKKIRKRGGKSIVITIDDGTGYLTANLRRDIVKGLDKQVAYEKIRKLYEAGDTVIPSEVEELVKDTNIFPIPELEKNSVYSVTVAFRPAFGDGTYSAQVIKIHPLKLADNGMLPIRLRFPSSDSPSKNFLKLKRALASNLSKKIPGDYPIYQAEYTKLSLPKPIEVEYLDAIAIMKKENSSKAEKTPKKKSKSKENVRSWPPPRVVEEPDISSVIKNNEKELTISAIDNLDYKDTGLTADKNQKLEQVVDKFLGVENFDFGVFDQTILE
jgi:hypothetical protein